MYTTIVKGLCKVNFSNSSDGMVCVSYYQNLDNQRCLGWKIPKIVINELIQWWTKIKKNEKKFFPLIEVAKNCKITMVTEGYVMIKELDQFERLKLTGFDLPAVVVEAMVEWNEKSLNKKE